MLISNVSVDFGVKYIKAIRMLIAGVAFQKDGKTWHVTSHWGDELGTITTHVICALNRHMRQRGYNLVCNHPMYNIDDKPTVTYYYNNWSVEEMVHLLENLPNDVCHID